MIFSAAAMEDREAVVHCAGLVSLKLGDRDALQRVNVDGTRNVLEAAACRRLRLIHTSTIATLGPTSEPRPLAEDARLGRAIGREMRRGALTE